NMKVTLIGRPSRELTYLAKQLYKDNYLQKVITFRYLDVNNSHETLKLLLRLKKGNDINKFTKPVLSVYVLNSLLRKLSYPILKQRSTEFANHTFDKYFSVIASNSLPLDSEIYHGWTYYSLNSFQKLLKKNPTGVKILEMYSVYPKFGIETYEKYFNKSQFVLPSSGRIKMLDKELKIADVIVVPSEFVKKGLPNNIDGSKVYVIPFGTDCIKFFPKDKGKDFYAGKELIVLFVGSIGYRKGFHLLYNAIERLKSDGKKIKFRVVGSVEKIYLPRFKEIAGNIEYLGRIPHDKLNDIYNSAHLFALPSYLEGSPLVTYESLASGLPVIVSEGMQPLIEEGKNGYFTKINDVNDIADKIKWVYENRDWLVEASKSARDSALKNTWEVRYNRLIDLYKNLLRR
ncbi:MAG: glycosyltransferase family 4 protein, partial [Candidatus Nanoarchaeia archaeon]|nr:glycosyltransferase family 4 protein [Candidatus Jingweiarchaeum tengchongense]